MVLSVDEARQVFRDAVACSQVVETVALAKALNRICARDVYSELEVPPADNSAMDGYAVNSADIVSTPMTLPVSSRIPAGATSTPLEAGTAARIFTGANMPVGADAVVIQEHCRADAGKVTIDQAVSIGDNIRPAGQDIRIGDLIARQGQKLSAVDLGLLASVGLDQVAVYQPLKVAIFSTGDELAEPGQTLQPGQIYNSNRVVLAALCEQAGYEVIDCGRVEDTLEATKAALLPASAQADVILSTGGVSVGEEDHIRPAVEELGELKQWKVQMKPGKPVVLGRVRETPFVGLPGNPVSAFVVFKVMAMPLLQTLQGEEVSSLDAIDVPAGFHKHAGSREEFIRVRLNRDSGRAVADLFDNQSSGVLFSLSWADGLVRQRVGQEIAEGDWVEFIPLRGV